MIILLFASFLFFYSTSKINAQETCLITDPACQPRMEYLYSEGSGTTIHDTSGNSLPGSLVEGVSWVDGKLGTGLLFDGYEGYVNAGSSDSIDNLPEGSFSGESWIKIAPPLAGNNRYFGIMHKVGSSEENGWFFNVNWIDSEQKYQLWFFQRMTQRTVNYAAEIPMTPNEWHHVAFTYDEISKTIKFYFDGQQVVSQKSVSGLGDYVGDDSGDLIVGRFRTTFTPMNLDSTRLYAYERQSSEIARASKVVDVRDFGASGDDQVFDQGAFLSAAQYLNQFGGGIVYIPSGTYLLDRVNGTRSTIELDGMSNIDFVGDGDTSILKLNPLGNYPEHADTHIMQLKQTNSISFSDFKIDGSKEAYTYHDEQMHGIYLLNARDTRMNRMTFFEMRGDGIFVIGDNEVACTEIPCFTENIYVGNSAFLNNGRSGIANQGGIRKITYEGNIFNFTSDQDIDFEPTGIRPGPEDVTIRNNILNHSNGTFSLTLGGTTPELKSKRFVVTDNHITGGVMIFRMDDIVFSGNTIEIPNTFYQRALTIWSHTSNVLIQNNTITSNGDYVVYAAYDTNSNSTIDSNVIVQNGFGDGIMLYATKDNHTVSNNMIYGQPSGVSLNGIVARIPSNDHVYRTNYTITNNSISGFTQGVVVSTNNIETKYDVMAVTNNTWYVPTILPGMKPVLFKTGNNDDAPATDVIINPTVSGNYIIAD